MIHLDLKVKMDFPPEILTQAAEMTLGQMEAMEADLTIVVTTDEEMKILNKKYLGINSPTDVLSFPAGETDPETKRFYLGDIVISLPRAQEQALARKSTLEDEMRLLVIHGILHLLGYDHAEEMDKVRMWRIQDKLRTHLGESFSETEEQ